MLKFFSVNGNMGRLDYYKSLLFRFLIWIVTGFILALVCLLVFGNPFMRLWSFFLYYPCIVPVNFRRANDIRMNWAWILLGLFLGLLPVVGLVLNSNGINTALAIYSWGIFSVLLFMPGQAHKDFVRSKNQVA